MCFLSWGGRKGMDNTTSLMRGWWDLFTALMMVVMSMCANWSWMVWCEWWWWWCHVNNGWNGSRIIKLTKTILYISKELKKGNVHEEEPINQLMWIDWNWMMEGQRRWSKNIKIFPKNGNRQRIKSIDWMRSECRALIICGPYPSAADQSLCISAQRSTAVWHRG